MKKKQVFKTYSQTNLNLPPLETLVPEDHLSRTVNDFVDSLDMDFEGLYKGGGTSAYHPQMLLKVLLYAYSVGNYSSRGIMTSCSENIHFMWLSGMQYPDHRTINNFRNLIADIFPEIFAQMLERIKSEGYVSLEKYFVDGTKLEANANKHSYVWSKNVQRYKEKHKEQITQMMKEIEELNEEEDTPSVKKKRKRLLKQLSFRREKLHTYSQYEALLGQRKSFSKTDVDATFMRLKDDRLRPCYNVMIGSENQFILNFSLHQKSTEADFLIEHLEQLSTLPKAVVADAGYGSEENYEYLEKKGIKNYVKFNRFFQQSKRSFKKKIFDKNNFHYDEEKDVYICPEQRELGFVQERFARNANGYLSTYKTYQCEDCSNCPVSTQCKQGQGNRRIQFSERYEYFKEQARQHLNSEQGIKLRKQRNTDVETVFADIKHNYHFQRFMLRGLKQVKLEFGLVAIAHNLRKLHTKRGGKLPFYSLLSDLFVLFFQLLIVFSLNHKKKTA